MITEICQDLSIILSAVPTAKYDLQLYRYLESETIRELIIAVRVHREILSVEKKMSPTG